MNGNNILLGTNIILYLLSGDKELAEILQDQQAYISFITELEILGYANTKEEENWINLFLDQCHVIGYNQGIKTNTLLIRKAKKLNSLILSFWRWLNFWAFLF